MQEYPGLKPNWNFDNKLFAFKNEEKTIISRILPQIGRSEIGL